MSTCPLQGNEDDCNFMSENLVYNYLEHQKMDPSYLEVEKTGSQLFRTRKTVSQLFGEKKVDPC